MAVIPLGVEAYSRAASHQPDVRLVNLYMEEDKSKASPDQFMRLQRPGLARQLTLPAGVRAIYSSDNGVTNLPLVVAGGKLYTIDGLSADECGTVTNDGDSASIAATALEVAVASAGDLFVYNGSTTTQVTIPSGHSCIDLATINGYLLVATSSGTFYWVVPGASIIDGLNYATAEAKPDGMVAIRVLRDDIFMFGTDSIEVWQATGDADATFARATGRQMDRGCLNRDTLVNFDNSLVWVGDDKIVYRIGDGVPDRISTFGIEERLKKATDEPSAWAFTHFGHKFYCLRIPGQGTFAYDAATKLWCEFATPGAPVWAPHVGDDSPQGTVCGDSIGRIYTLDADSSKDDGVTFQRLVTGTVSIPARPIFNSSFAAGVGTAASAAFSLRWHDPRRGWSQPVTMQARGEADILNAWRLGQAQAPHRTFELSTIANTAVRISGAVANEAWRV